INIIYHRSSINQLIFAAGMFVLIWINFQDGVHTFHLKKQYLEGQYVFLLLGLMRVIDMGTGVNSQIIATSTYWRFEFLTGLLLLFLSLPLNYILTKRLGLIGPAIATLLALFVYNGIRYLFLWRRFNMQPFTWKSMYTLLLASFGYIVCHFLFYKQQGFLWIFLRSTLFLLIYCIGMIYLNLSPDLLPVWATVKKRLGMDKK
ncbi:MAG: polysaccharide biosynthesis C-terminal domain-containing protein, partial [Chitinophagales bacterium]